MNKKVIFLISLLGISLISMLIYQQTRDTTPALACNATIYFEDMPCYIVGNRVYKQNLTFPSGNRLMGNISISTPTLLKYKRFLLVPNKTGEWNRQ